MQPVKRRGTSALVVAIVGTIRWRPDGRRFTLETAAGRARARETAMPMIIDEIAVGLAVALGKKAIDRIWPDLAGPPPGGSQPPVDWSDGSHQLVYAESEPAHARSCLVEVAILTDDDITRAMGGPAVALVLTVEESTRGSALFEVDPDGFALELPEGDYSFYLFLVEATGDLETARLWGIGLPTVDLPMAESITWDDRDWMLDSVADEPVEVRGDGVLQMLLLSPDTWDDGPELFVDLFGDDRSDLTGRWRLEDDYGHGTSVNEADLVEHRGLLSGVVLMDSVADAGERWLVQQWVSGEVYTDGSFRMHGTELRVLAGPDEDYFFDSWFGRPAGHNVYAGVTQDTAGSSGSFLMARLA